MDAIGSGPAAPDARGAIPPPRRRRVRRTLLVILGLAIVLVGADFFIFLNQMPETEGAPARNADGIVEAAIIPYTYSNTNLQGLRAGDDQRVRLDAEL